MAMAGDDDDDVVLSDVEADEPSPIPIKDPSPEDVSVDRFREILAELDRERQARVAAENSKSELQVSFNRLKALAHEAIKKRDECGRQRDEAVREKEEALKSIESITGQLAEAKRLRDEVIMQRDDLSKQLDEASKSKDGLRSEVETSAHMLVSGIEKISGKVNNFKNFSAGALPRSQKYSGLPAVAYGVIKKTNEIVEELVRQIYIANKSKDQAREQMDQRNYEIAIEVSQLEATISGLREDVAKKNSIIENLEGIVAEKDAKISQMEIEMSEKIDQAQNEGMALKDLVGEYEDKLRGLELKMDTERPLLVDQLNLVSRIHGRIYDVIKIVDADNLDHSEVSESLFMPQDMDLEENIRASLAGMESIYELAKILHRKTVDLVEEKNRELKGLNEDAGQLIKEKAHIGSLLRSALSSKMSLDRNSKKHELFQAAENGLRNAGIDFKFDKLVGDENKAETDGTQQDEIYTLASTLENIIKTSQLEILELQHSVDELRAESRLLNEHVEAQAKELDQRMLRIEELEKKERLANENVCSAEPPQELKELNHCNQNMQVDGLMMDIAAAEEEISRWKVAAEQEAAAGRAVEQEFLSQLSTIKQELEEARHAMVESEKRLKYKEETAAAAMAARDAAEKSLRLADVRSSRLGERVEELSRRLEEFEMQSDARGTKSSRYMCWPWQWLGLDFVGSRRLDTEQQSSNEMELSEPLL